MINNRSFMQKISSKRTMLLQLVFVTLTFVMMVVSSSLFVRNILKNHLTREAGDMLSQTKLRIESDLIEPQTALSIVSNTIRGMILQGYGFDSVCGYLEDIHKEMDNKMIGFIFDGFFAYFDVYGGVFFHSGGWEDEDFAVTERPWYKAGMEAGEETAVTPIYFSSRTNQYDITYVHRIFDNEGEPLGMICINVPLERIRNHVVNMQIAEGGYGALLNETIDVIAHPNQEFIGKPARQVSPGFSLIASELESGSDVFEREFESYLGQWIVASTMRLDSGWVLTLITPQAVYYQEMQNMIFIISILGATFAVVLIIILIRIDLAKDKSDEQNRRKDALLLDMEKLREADKRTQIMLDATPLGCKLWDRDLNVIECNQEAVHLFNLSDKQEFLNRFFDLSPEYQPDGILTKDKAAILVKKAFDEGRCQFEWMHQKPNGEPIPCEVTLVRVKHKEDFAVAGYIRDLREYKLMMSQLQAALIEAQEANAAKSKFLATMSHEIRTPMNVILGVAESQLFSEISPQKAKESFEKIFDSGNWLLHIINDILDLSKIEADKFELNPVAYEALSLINDTVNMNVMQFAHKQVEFKLEVDENIPLFLFGDELRIKQVLNNLLSNAFKYTNVGEVKLSLSSQNSTEKNTTLIICVTDTGQGMTSEQMSKLFDEYTRFNLEANRTTTGTGLGMTITNNLVKMMGGTINVDSTPGEGTVFTVRIPQGITEPGVLVGKKAIDDLKRFNFSNKQREKNTKIVREPMPYGKVLVVDDMKSNLDVAKLLLNPYKLQIDTASSGFEAIDIIKAGKEYDILFMDHMMPEMDGIETVKKLRQFGYNHPIIALTADAVAGQKDMFLANGFDAFISKPIDIRQLNDSLNKFIRDKERSRQDVLPKEVNQDYIDTGNEQTIQIPGVNADAGIALYNGETDIFISVLRSYVSNALSVIERMRTVTEESLPNYAINVHGLKGISSGIGAEKIRDAAANLEMLAKSGNLTSVLDGNENVISDTESLVDGIKAWLNEHDVQRPKPRLERPDRNLLIILRKSCEAYDMKGVDQVMDELESVSYDNDGELVAWLRDKIDGSDFSSVAERLSEYGDKFE